MVVPFGYRVALLVARLGSLAVVFMFWLTTCSVSTGNHPAGLSRIQVEFMRGALLTYANDTGRLPDPDTEPDWPTKLDQGMYPFIMSGFEATQGTILDSWGHPIVYRPSRLSTAGSANQPPTLVIYSVGQNGIDDGGAADDIVPGAPIRSGYYWKRHWPLAHTLAGASGTAISVLSVVWLRASQNRGRWRTIVICVLGSSLVFLAFLYTDGYHIRKIGWGEARLAHMLGMALLTFVVIDPVLVLLRDQALAQRAIRLSSRSICPSCGYDLAGLPSTTCPECGATPSPP